MDLELSVPTTSRNPSFDSEILAKILEHTKAVLYLYDPWEGRSLYQNRSLAELFGIPREKKEELVNDWLELMHPEDIARFPAHRQRLRDLRQDEEALFEFRLRDGEDNWRWFVSHDTPFRMNENGSAALIVGHSTDITLEKQAEQRLEMVLGELAHRTRNLHAMVRSIVTLTYKNDSGNFLETVNSRLGALSRANDMMLGAREEDFVLRELIDYALEPHAAQGRVRLRGPEAVLSSISATSFALVLNELITNAVKYGALSEPGGTIEVTVEPEPKGCLLIWSERCQRLIEPPKHTGFGTDLIAGAVHGLGGNVTTEWDRQGLTCTIALPADIVRCSSG